MRPGPPPTQVHLHGCSRDGACEGHSGTSESNGLVMCCSEDCEDCSISTSQTGSVLTGTCVCGSLELVLAESAREPPPGRPGGRSEAEQEAAEPSLPPMAMDPVPPMRPMAPMAPMKPMKPMKPMEPMKPPAPAPAAARVHLHGCAMDGACEGRSSTAESNGVVLCCREDCEDCAISTSQSGSVLTATCVCHESDSAPRLNAEEPSGPWSRESVAAGALLAGALAVSATAAASVVWSLCRHRGGGHEPLLGPRH